MFVLAACGNPQAHVDQPSPKASPKLGTVETVGGPGFCLEGKPIVEPESQQVGALAVDPSGVLHVDVGVPGKGVIGRLDSDGRATLIQTGPERRGEGTALQAERFKPGRLATDGKGGVLVASGQRLLLANQGLRTVLDPESPNNGAYRSPGRITSLAADKQGNLFIAGVSQGQRKSFDVFYKNNGPNPLTLLRGTASEVAIAPGELRAIDLSRLNGKNSMAFRDNRPSMAASGSILYLAGSWVRDGTVHAGVRAVNLGDQTVSMHGVQLSPGQVEVVAGGAPAGFAGDEKSVFSQLPGIDADESGNLYVADENNHRIRKIDPAGKVTTLVGYGAAGKRGGFNGNGMPGRGTRLNYPFDVKVGSAGRLYFSDRANGQVRYLDPGGNIRGALGKGLGTSVQCPLSVKTGGEGAKTQPARRGGPTSLSSDGNGNVYAISPELALVGRLRSSGQLAPVASAMNRRDLQAPVAVEADDGGTGLYLYDGPTVKYLNLSNRPVVVAGVRIGANGLERIAGTGATLSSPEAAKDGQALRLPLGFSGALAEGPKGELFIADYGSTTVRMLDSGGHLSTVAGGGGSRPPDSCCALPVGLATDRNGNLYIADRLAFRVWFLNRQQQPFIVHGLRVAPGSITAIAGNGRSGFGEDGRKAVDAGLSQPWGLVVDGAGNLYIADGGDHTVRKVDRSGVLSTVAGTGAAGFNGDMLDPRLTLLFEPRAVALDRCGNLLIADSGNDRIRRLTLKVPCRAG